MLNITKICLCLLCLAWIACSGGCSSKKTAAPPDSKTTEGPVLAPPQQPATLPSQGAEAAPPAGDAKDAARIKASLAVLSTDDRALAEKQKICPVSGELLGSMGTPKKLSVAGHDVFICCEGCEESLTKEPAKFLAKIGLKPAPQ